MWCKKKLIQVRRCGVRCILFQMKYQLDVIKVGQCFNTFFIILGLLAKGVCSELIATLTIVDYRMVVQNNGSLIK